MAHPQPGMPALLSITRRPAEELRQKQELPALARLPVLRKYWPQVCVGFDSGIESIYQFLERGVASHHLVHSLFVNHVA